MGLFSSDPKKKGRDKPGQARKDAQKDMKSTGFAPERCKHDDCDYAYVFPGDGTENVTKTCNGCLQVWRWTNGKIR
jgi:hypothetical protein